MKIKINDKLECRPPIRMPSSMIGGNSSSIAGDGLDSPRKVARYLLLLKCLLAVMVISTSRAIIRQLQVGDIDKSPFPSVSSSSSFLPPPPPVCSKEQMEIVRQQFPPGKTSKYTRCPHATWWDDHMYEVFLHEAASAMSHPSSSSLLSPNNPNSSFRVGIALGCNKGDDAVELLAKLSGNKQISVEKFRESFSNAALVIDPNANLKRACPIRDMTTLDMYHPLWKWDSSSSQLLQPPNDVSSSSLLSMKKTQPTTTTTTSAHVFCVEAASGTFNSLRQARDEMDASYRDHFTVTHAAMGSTDGTAYFPIVFPGYEAMGLCQGDGTKSKNEPPPKNCEAVDMYTVDTYVNKVVQPKVMMESVVATSEYRSLQETQLVGFDSSPFLIDFLSVDVEGFDWDVLGLGGADTTLSRVKYLEFEYHNMGTWPKYNLSDVTTQLWDKHNFVCYYSGDGLLWRLTNCFQDYYNAHGWSNVACVNPRLDPMLAERMEAMFQRQLLGVE